MKRHANAHEDENTNTHREVRTSRSKKLQSWVFFGIASLLLFALGYFLSWYYSPVQTCIRTCDASMGDALTPYFHQMYVEQCSGPNYYRGDAGTKEVLEFIESCTAATPPR